MGTDYLSSMTLKDLREIASRMKISGRSSMGKVELVSAIRVEVDLDHQEAITLNWNKNVQQRNAIIHDAHEKRVTGYLRQRNVRDNDIRKLTDRQRRRARKKLSRMLGGK